MLCCQSQTHLSLDSVVILLAVSREMGFQSANHQQCFEFHVSLFAEDHYFVGHVVEQLFVVCKENHCVAQSGRSVQLVTRLVLNHEQLGSSLAHIRPFNTESEANFLALQIE